MLLLFQNKITMCIEVMLCADCVCGAHKAQSPEVAVVQSSSDLLLEQWTVTVVNTRWVSHQILWATGPFMCGYY